MKRFVRFIILAAIGFALGGVLAYMQGGESATQKAPVSQEAPVTQEAQVEAAAVTPPAVGGAFSLVDQNGQPVTQGSWPGKFKLVFFGFTHCPDVCPVALDKMTTVLNMLGADADKVQTLFITTDPARDTSAVMKAYLANYNPSILGLTGTEEQVKQAEDAYKVYAAKSKVAGSEDYMVDHSALMYLMTDDDKPLEIFKSEDTAEVLAGKIKAHLPGDAPADAPVGAPTEAPVEAPVDVPAPAAAPAVEEGPAAEEAQPQ